MLWQQANRLPRSCALVVLPMLRFCGVISRSYARPMTRGTMLLSVNSSA